MTDNILIVANLYAQGIKHVEDRRAQWMAKHDELETHLKEIADALNEKAAYKQGFYVDKLHAFNEEINGSCAGMPSLSLRSGDMPMQMTFRNALGERKEYTETGFQISFNPTITGQVIVLLFPHESDLSKPANPYVTLAVIDEPGNITMDVIDEIVARGIEAAFYSSFTGMSEQNRQPEGQEAAKEPPPVPHSTNPIGFRRYETTEKVK